MWSLQPAILMVGQTLMIILILSEDVNRTGLLSFLQLRRVPKHRRCATALANKPKYASGLVMVNVAPFKSARGYDNNMSRSAIVTSP